MKLFLISTALVFLLTACAVLPERVCDSAEWRAIGFEDGIRGTTPAAFSTHRKACSVQSVATSFGDYKRGHDEGIAQFCRPQNGYSQGTRGTANQGVCPDHLKTAFETAHREGFTLYQKRSEMHRISAELDAARERAQTIDQEIAGMTATLASSAIPPVERGNLTLKIKHLTEEKIEVENAIPVLEHAYRQAERDYTAFKSRNGQQYSALK